MQISEILTIFFGSTTITSLVIAWKSRKYEVNKVKTDAVDKMADVYKKMSEQTEKRLDEMQQTIDSLRKDLNLYVNQCAKCSNNKIGKQ